MEIPLLLNNGHADLALHFCWVEELGRADLGREFACAELWCKWHAWVCTLAHWPSGGKGQAL